MSEAIDGLKQRLVGAFVIVMLAIIFLPMIFDKPHQSESVVIKEIPSKPEFKTIEISRPQKNEFQPLAESGIDNRIVKLSQAEKNQNAEKTDATDASHPKVKKDLTVSSLAHNTLDEKQTKAIAPAQIKDNKVVPVSKPLVSDLSVFKNVWMVQLGTFSNIKNAYKLRDRLRKDGIDGHTKPTTLAGKKALKVFTGPFVKKREALKAKKRVDSKYKVDSRLVYFNS